MLAHMNCGKDGIAPQYLHHKLEITPGKVSLLKTILMSKPRRAKQESQSASSKKLKTLKRKSPKFVQDDASSDILPDDPQFDDILDTNMCIGPAEDPDRQGQAMVGDNVVINLAGKKSHYNM
ncbi:hypothetical protein QYM36_004645 [Artemia franciscana]|uniref:Uncharacterized protein n=1 Tax=Artemia franciscana TaxID=6661 RepID=A0AA88HZ79_ARTSF|nr:hypothetical protein QYM36_004645 [Artemia franciscana]